MKHTAVTPCINLALSGKGHRMGPPTRDLRDENTVKSLNKGRLYLIYAIIVAQLPMLAPAECVQPAIFCDHSSVEATA